MKKLAAIFLFMFNNISADKLFDPLETAIRKSSVNKVKNNLENAQDIKENKARYLYLAQERVRLRSLKYNLIKESTASYTNIILYLAAKGLLSSIIARDIINNEIDIKYKVSLITVLGAINLGAVVILIRSKLKERRNKHKYENAVQVEKLIAEFKITN